MLSALVQKPTASSLDGVNSQAPRVRVALGRNSVGAVSRAVAGAEIKDDEIRLEMTVLGRGNNKISGGSAGPTPQSAIRLICGRSSLPQAGSSGSRGR